MLNLSIIWLANNLPADGIWTLRVVDTYNGDGGIINSVSLSM